MKKAIVIGGGWAGLSAAVELAEKDFNVILLEQSGRLGGRASSFVDEKTSEIIDNGQHFFSGCYNHTIRFLQKIGSLNRLKFQNNLSIDFVDQKGIYSKLSCLPFPSPWHLLSGLIRLKTLSLKDKWNLLKVYQALQNESGEQADSLTVEEWLIRLNQSENSRKVLWDLITLAALNDHPKRAEANALITVLKESFFRDRESASLGISTVGLSELCGSPTEKYLSDRKCELQKNKLVTHISIQNDAVKNILLRDGAALQADFYVSALPHFSLSKLLSEEMANMPFFAPMKKLKSSPIISIHLWFDREFMTKEFVGMLNTNSQWIFNKNKILGSNKGAYSITISGAQDYLGKTDEEIVNICLKEIHNAFPESQNSRLLNSKIIREKNATLSPAVGYTKNRLSQKTPIKNLFLCGDWTQTGLPATIESAVLSGVRAAELAVNSN